MRQRCHPDVAGGGGREYAETQQAVLMGEFRSPRQTWRVSGQDEV